MYERQMELLNSQVNEELTRRAQQQSTNALLLSSNYSPIGNASYIGGSTSPNSQKSTDDVLKELRNVKEKFDFERRLLRKKLKVENQARIQLEGLSRKLMDDVEDLKRKRYFKSDICRVFIYTHYIK